MALLKHKLLLLFFIANSIAAIAQQIHTVQQGETLYRLTRIYSVTMEDLLRANPELSAENFPVGYQVRIPATTSANKRVALVLPFSVDKPTAQSNRMLEFYEGFLLAIDTLRKTGLSIDLKVFDSQKSIEGIGNSDIIIGGYTQDEILRLAVYASAKTPLVLPFTNTVQNNPHIYTVNTPQSALYPTIHKQLSTYFPKTTYYILTTSNGAAVQNKHEFVAGLQTYVKAQGVQTVIVPDNTTAAQLTAMVSNSEDATFIFANSSQAAIEEWGKRLADVKQQATKTTTRLLGYPEWQTYEASLLADFHRLDTYIYTSFYTNAAFPSARNFNYKFRHWFNHFPTQSNPVVAMLGYDIALHFLAPNSSLKNAVTQTGFDFGNSNSNTNKNLYLVHYAPLQGGVLQINKTELQ